MYSPSSFFAVASNCDDTAFTWYNSARLSPKLCGQRSDDHDMGNRDKYILFI